MSANAIPYTPVEFICKCGIKCRVDCEFIPGPSASPFYQHACGNDEGDYMPGPIIAVWEEHNGTWVPIWKSTGL